MERKTIWIGTNNTIELYSVDWSLDGWCEKLHAECVEFVRTRLLLDFFGMNYGGFPLMIVDESGLINNKPVNNIASRFYGDHIYGDVLLAVQDEEDVFPPDDSLQMYVRLCNFLKVLRSKGVL